MRNYSGRFLIWLIFVFFVVTLLSIYFTHFLDIQPVPDSQPLNRSSPVSHFAGLILARGGSKGIPLKNLARLKNVTLLARALQTMEEFGHFDSIWVSTDSPEISSEAERSRAKVHRRAAYTATDSASSIVALKEFLDKHQEVSRVALVQCTSPFLRAEYLAEGERLLEEGLNSAFSVSRLHKLRWSYNSSGFLKADNFDPQERPRRQDWAGDIIENGMFYITEAHLVKKYNLLQAGRLGIVEVPLNRSLEIDTLADLEMAEILLNHLEEA